MCLFLGAASLPSRFLEWVELPSPPRTYSDPVRPALPCAPPPMTPWTLGARHRGHHDASGGRVTLLSPEWKIAVSCGNKKQRPCRPYGRGGAPRLAKARQQPTPKREEATPRVRRRQARLGRAIKRTRTAVDTKGCVEHAAALSILWPLRPQGGGPAAAFAPSLTAAGRAAPGALPIEPPTDGGRRFLSSGGGTDWWPPWRHNKPCRGQG